MITKPVTPGCPTSSLQSWEKDVSRARETASSGGIFKQLEAAGFGF